MKSVSLVPSQDKVLLALSPSALINSRLTAHTEGDVQWRTHHPLCTHTRAHNASFDDSNLNNDTNNTDLCAAAYGPDDSRQ